MTAPAGPLPDGSLVLDQPVSLPEVLDVLIVGAGPAGTATAFRAKELGLAALVIEYDDVMKRIRDYDRHKPIKPDFGAGKQMGFPVGGSLVAELQFDDIDKDEMYAKWRQLYQRHSVPVRIGLELTGLERRDDLWEAKVRNSNENRDEVITARHVVLALGGGMPRTLDIPGNVLSVATRLVGAEHFVGASACVIGGGTVAAEAVIAISGAKAAADDPEAVYWMYRGEKMPKVSEALAPDLFQAVNLNGNVRYLPNSEPVAIIKRSDGSEYLRVEVERKEVANKPLESVQYEFRASHCLACIGQELPTRLLGSFGIAQLVGGPSNKSAFALSPLLESRLPNVYMVGDLLNQMFFECQSFTADPSTFEERSHRGNIKRALTDGVIVANVIAQKLAGREDIRIDVDIQKKPPSKKAVPQERKAVTPAYAALVRILEGGVEAEQFQLTPDGTTTIGADPSCEVAFKDDTAMAARHLSIVGQRGGYLVGETAPAGAFLRLSEDRAREVPSAAVIKVGAQWLVFDAGGASPSFTHHDASGSVVGRHRLSEGTIVVGRQAPDITLSASDMSLSRRHMSITLRGGKVSVRDLKSANGTYLSLVEGMPLRSGDEIRVGHQALRLTDIEQAHPMVIEFKTGSMRRPPMPPQPSPPPTPEEVVSTAGPPVTGAAAQQAAPTGPVIRFRDAGKTCPFRQGESICEVAERNGVEISSECHVGICGSDPVLVLDGHDNLNLMTDNERGTLEELCGVDPGRYRLACVARPTGPIVVSLKTD